MKLLKISFLTGLAMVIADLSDDYDYENEEYEDGDEIIDSNRCELLDDDITEEERFNLGCLEDGFRAYGQARSILKDLLCKDRDSPRDWCHSPELNKDLFRMVANYGCNCYSKNKMPGPGLRVPGFNGKPLEDDDLDAACTVLARRNRCIDIVHDDCSYTSTYQYTWNSNNKKVKCNLGTRCEKKLCAMDREFAKKVRTILFSSGLSPAEFKEENRRNKNVYNKSGKCFGNSPQVDNWRCCGSVFKKEPYNADVQSCCDGNVVEIGTLC